METSTIRIFIRTLSDHLDRSRVPDILEDLQSALLEENGIHARAYADSITVILEVPTDGLVDAVQTLRSLQLI